MACVLPLALAASSLPVGIGLSRVPFVCQAPKPFLPCEMTTAAKAVPRVAAVVFVPPRVQTTMSPRVQSANDVGDVGVGFGAHAGVWAPGFVVVHVEAAHSGAKKCHQE